MDQPDSKPFNENRHLVEVVPVTVIIMDYAQLIQHQLLVITIILNDFRSSAAAHAPPD